MLNYKRPLSEVKEGDKVIIDDNNHKKQILTVEKVTSAYIHTSDGSVWRISDGRKKGIDTRQRMNWGASSIEFVTDEYLTKFRREIYWSNTCHFLYTIREDELKNIPNEQREQIISLALQLKNIIRPKK